MSVNINDILNLPLKFRWYDMIDAGVKLEEYRELKPFWIKRIVKCFKWCSKPVVKNISGLSYAFDNLMTGDKKCYSTENGGLCCSNVRDFTKIAGGYKYVVFRRGYTKTTMKFEIESISIGRGKPEWGAPDKDVFIIKLGKRVY